MTQRKHVLIVGGTKGLGRVVTERFLNQNFEITVLSRNKIDIPSTKGVLNHIKVDLESLTIADHWPERVFEKSGPINYIIFCQRYRGHTDPWSGEMQVTLKATDLIINSFVDYFCTEGDKAIAVISSAYANFVGGSQPVSYHIAKAGLNQLIKYYGWKLGKRQIRINGVMPLTYLKDESKNYYLTQPELIKLYSDFVPLQRMGNAEDSANLIEFLCSEKASFITGQSIFVDGGVSVIWPEELAKLGTNC